MTTFVLLYHIKQIINLYKSCNNLVMMRDFFIIFIKAFCLFKVVTESAFEKAEKGEKIHDWT